MLEIIILASPFVLLWVAIKLTKTLALIDRLGPHKLFTRMEMHSRTVRIIARVCSR